MFRFIRIKLLRTINSQMNKVCFGVLFSVLLIILIVRCICDVDSIFIARWVISEKPRSKLKYHSARDLYVPKEVLEFEAKFVDTVGENGKGVNIDSNQLVDEIVKKYAHNRIASDTMSLKRSLPDVRHTECKSMDYDKELPSASVIIIFNNEILSTLLRTVWSVLRTSPPEHLKEVILVDDGSNLTEIKTTLPLYLKYRLPDNVILHKEPKQLGLIRARLAGARVATGDAIIFLDSHCEATIGWLEPLLQRIKQKPSNIVIPSIDSINARNLEYNGHPGGIHVMVGSFTWSGHFTWISYNSDIPRKASDPAPTATMAGGLFGANRKFFFHIGGYDEGMFGWGGENLELSFRTWRCGGSMENIPCSHVGHIFRDFHPYFIPHDSHGINTARMAEVWMDDYKRFFYMHRQDLSRERDIPVSIGDLSDRIVLKNKLRCKSFKWFLEKIAPEKFILDEQSIRYGRVRNRKFNHMCLDHLQRDMAHKGTQYFMGQYPCHGFLGSSQYICFSKKNELRNEYMCGKPKKESPNLFKLKMQRCDMDKGNNGWRLTNDGAIEYIDEELCLTSPGEEHSTDLLLKKCDGSDEQKWDFEFINDT